MGEDWVRGGVRGRGSSKQLWEGVIRAWQTWRRTVILAGFLFCFVLPA